MRFAQTLSADGTVACGSCHQPERAYSDGLAQASGSSGRRGTRNAPGLLDVGRQRSLFWDGRRARLEIQALDPLLNEVEHGWRARQRCCRSCARRRRIRQRLPQRSVARRARASRSPRSARPRRWQRSSARWCRRHRRSIAFSPAIEPRCRPRRGGAGWCSISRHAVHAAMSQSAMMASCRCSPDHAFHSLAIGFSDVERHLPELTARLTTLRRGDAPLGREVLLDRDLAQLGRFAVTLDPRDLAAFKTPGLRNVALTAPYMHDGSVATLGEAVDLEVCSRGARDEQPTILTPSERIDLVAFLEALTGDPAR
ncbi:MAG: cytochrome c peroxidase [Kofleriaceae bacterium]